MRPIRPLASVNQRLPSGPAVIPTGWRSTENGPGGAIGNSVTTPSGVIRPMRPGLANSVNHRLPSGPSVIPRGCAFAENPGVVPPEAIVVISPAGVTLVIRPGPACSVNHRLPSGPAVIAVVKLPSRTLRGYSVTAPPGVIFTTPPSLVKSPNQRFPSGPRAT